MMIDHGSWSLSESSGRILHAKRDDTGIDWYEFVALKPFGEGSVVMTVGPTGTGAFIVQAATRDPTAIFPVGMRVIEETDYAGSNPFEDFHNRVYDSGKLGDMFVLPPLPSIPDLLKRIIALEEKVGLSGG